MIGTIHRGHYLQRGRGLGGIFASIMRILKPIVSKSISAGRKALADPSMKKAVASVKKSSIQAGTRALNQQIKKIAPSQPLPTPSAKKRVARASKTVKTKRVKKKNTSIFNDFK